jgi:exodeoxyribonuclease V gamma subunit
VAFHLTVAGSLVPLADAMADLLASEPLTDPFAPELVVTPAQGVRTWLDARLAHRLGAEDGTTNGIVANLDHVFPAKLVERALGPNAQLGRWSTGPLTWAVHHVLVASDGVFDEQPDAVRARAIADLFDRYTLYRQDMVVRWSEGTFVDAAGSPIGEHHLWQPRLWRAVQDHLGGPSDAQRMKDLIAELRNGASPSALEATVPDRVIVFGLASVPPPHLQVLAALSRTIDVHIHAPVASAQRWLSLRSQVARPLVLPVLRNLEESERLIGRGHPLVTSWGRASREANLLLLDAATQAGAEVRAPVVAEPPGASASLLARLQFDVRADHAPPGAPRSDAPDARVVFDPATDPSVRWHRAYGPARQVEVLRDSLLHVLEETDPTGEPRYEARDIVVLCTDVARFAPLIEATFAGDPDHGLPEIPVKVADRTLQQDNPLLDAAAALLNLLEGRFRASDVLSFVSREPVRRRFGLSGEVIARIGEWVRATNIRWGLDEHDQLGFGLPGGLGVHTWRAGLDQLLLGATMAEQGPRLGLGDVAPFGDVEGSDVEIAGALAEFIDTLDRATAELREPATVEAWTTSLSKALGALCEVADADAWFWRPVEDVIETFRTDAILDGEARTIEVDPTELAALLESRLTTGGGRARFGTGAVTVSGPPALRGVPFKVICLVGLDRDVGAGALGSAEDLVLAQPCVGDRDARGEQRAQLLDAVLGAGERLLLFSTGNDVRTNAALPPIVAVADLVDVIDATARTPTGQSASHALTVDHPRQAWSERAFVSGAIIGGPWSFDRGAKAAAESRRHRVADEPGLAEPLPPTTNGHPGDPTNVVIELADLEWALENPARTFLEGRLGVSIPAEQDEPEDQIPLQIGGLEAWKLVDDLLDIRLETEPAGEVPDANGWSEYTRRRGGVPPLGFGNEAVDGANHSVTSLIDAMNSLIGSENPSFASVTIDVPFTMTDGRVVQLRGAVPRVVGSDVVAISPSTIKAKDELVAWVRLAALTLQDPTRSWRAVIIGRGQGTSSAVTAEHRLNDPGDAPRVLEVAIDLRARASCDAVPAIPTTTQSLHRNGVGAAAGSWAGRFGESSDRWFSMLFGTDFDDLRGLPLRADEAGPGWPIAPVSRLHLWADRVWGAFDDTIHDIGAEKRAAAKAAKAANAAGKNAGKAATKPSGPVGGDDR